MGSVAKQDKPLWAQIPDSPSFANLKADYGKVREHPVPALEDLAAPHIGSYNWMVDDGIKAALRNMSGVSFRLPSGDKVELKVTAAKFFRPMLAQNAQGCKNRKVYPTECRQRYVSYKGDMVIQMSWWLNGEEQQPLEKNMGKMPVMVKSKLCNLNGLTPQQLVDRGEHETEFGGYFLTKGHEKLIRMLMATRANFPHFLMRSSWENRGRGFTSKGVVIRCVRDDKSSVNNVLHYLSDGSCKLMCNVGRELFFIPIMLVLKALVDVTDEYIYKQVTSGYEDNIILKGYVADMLRGLHDEGVHSHHEAKMYLGKTFRHKFSLITGDWRTDSYCGEFLLTEGIAVHCKTNMDKFHILVHSLQKLYSGVEGSCTTENPDHTMMQEVLLAGHILLTILRDKLLNWLLTVQAVVLKKAAQHPHEKLKHADLAQIVQSTFTLEGNFEGFLATGNLPGRTGTTLAQRTGYTIIAENLNRNRYLAHFRSIHRGAFFQELRTTETRQLQPDAWGFICPVHTPDGAPCGLLNHLSAFCNVVTEDQDASKIPGLMASLGMIPISNKCPYPPKACLKVVLNGTVLGSILKEDGKKISAKLRSLKIQGDQVPKMTEVCFIQEDLKGQFPGLYLFTSTARMMRPVINLLENKVEYIGSFEQLYMDICIVPEEAYPGLTTHQEVNERAFMSHLASLIPMPDCNQSPRNMYQCQMGKQTMGTPYHTWHRFAENKLYRLHTPGAPFFRPVHHDYLQMDDYPSGTNAIVAVISYTGYDMEDSMIINKASFQRGFGHGCIYKTEHVDLKTLLQNANTNSTFQRDPEKPELEEKLGPDGLPHIGIYLEKNDPYYCYFNTEEGRYCVKKFAGAERAYVDSIKLKSDDVGMRVKSSVAISMRVPKHPRPGDKFASRAGQKGICSFLWPTEDMPFSETGIVPDILFNPHGFPSRMTVAMMVECMAGKTGSLFGLAHDASPFKFSEADPAPKYFGKLLELAGYNYYGTERMYSGAYGCEMNADIFFGVIYYQRLRHMVSEKWQVRSTGGIEPVKRQPIKGRRRGGGVRFGEMEKDCLISHGASHLLQDRLFFGSDGTSTHICTRCKSITSPTLTVPMLKPGHHLAERPVPKCRLCDSEEFIERIAIPYVFKYLVEQLAAMNIKVKIDSTKPEDQ